MFSVLPGCSKVLRCLGRLSAIAACRAYVSLRRGVRIISARLAHSPSISAAAKRWPFLPALRPSRAHRSVLVWGSVGRAPLAGRVARIFVGNARFAAGAYWVVCARPTVPPQGTWRGGLIPKSRSTRRAPLSLALCAAGAAATNVVPFAASSEDLRTFDRSHLFLVSMVAAFGLFSCLRLRVCALRARCPFRASRGLAVFPLGHKKKEGCALLNKSAVQ